MLCFILIEPPVYEKVGCHKQDGVPVLIQSMRVTPIKILEWTIDMEEFRHTLEEIISICATLAKERGYQVFGIVFYAECWSGPQAHVVHHEHSDNCYLDMVGKDYQAVLYKIID